MKNLKDILIESILDDVEDTLRAGDEYDIVVKQLKAIQNAIKTSTSSWKVISNERREGAKYINKETEHFYNCKDLIKYLGGPEDACWISIEYEITSWRSYRTVIRMKTYLNFGTDMREILQRCPLGIRKFGKGYDNEWEPDSEPIGLKDIVTMLKSLSPDELKERIQ
jgi:hypothetical protein